MSEKKVRKPESVFVHSSRGSMHILVIFRSLCARLSWVTLVKAALLRFSLAFWKYYQILEAGEGWAGRRVGGRVEGSDLKAKKQREAKSMMAAAPGENCEVGAF